MQWELRRFSLWIGMCIMGMLPQKYLMATNRCCIYPYIDTRVGRFILVLALLMSNGAEGHRVDIPWSSGARDNDYILAFKNIVAPVASEYAPDFTIILSGFDAARGDPLGCCGVSPTGYAQMTYLMISLIESCLL